MSKPSHMSTQPRHLAMGRCTEYWWKLGSKRLLYAMQCTNPVSAVLQCKLASGWGL